MKAITRFAGEYRFLSNFYPCTVSLDYHEYPTVEHAFQAAKSFDIRDRVRIIEAPTAGEAKRLGRGVTLRPDWNEVRVGVMYELLREKFAEKNFRRWLQQTAPAKLIEGNTWGDTFWGQVDGSGENQLGKLLMKIRKEMRR